MTDNPDRIPVTTRLRNNFLTGLNICAPLAITLWLTFGFIRWAESWVKPYIPARYKPETYLNVAVPGPAMILAIALTMLIASLGTNLIGRPNTPFGEPQL